MPVKRYQLELIRRRLRFIHRVLHEDYGEIKRASMLNALEARLLGLLSALRTYGVAVRWIRGVSDVPFRFEYVEPSETEGLNDVLKPALKNVEFWQLTHDFKRVGVDDGLPQAFDRWSRKLYLARRKAELRYRVECEAERATRENRFSIFVTLTINPEFAPRKTETFRSERWKSLTKRLRRTLPGLSYSAVVEGDESNPHIHILLFCDDVPKNWKHDPNKGRAVPNYREIKEAELFWKYGYSSWKIFRLGKRDAWRSLGHVWPVGSDGNPARALDYRAAGSYIAKYLTKEGEGVHRTRTSRGFGLWKIRKVLKKMPTPYLRPLTLTLGRKRRNPLPLNSLTRLNANAERERRIWNSRPTLLHRRLLIRKKPNLYSLILDAWRRRLETSQMKSYLLTAFRSLVAVDFTNPRRDSLAWKTYGELHADV